MEFDFYIEYIFPLLQIRFISINDSYDSAASSGMTGGMNVALQNLVYNMYSLDLSKKNFISIADKNEKWYTPSGKCQIWL